MFVTVFCDSFDLFSESCSPDLLLFYPERNLSNVLFITDSSKSNHHAYVDVPTNDTGLDMKTIADDSSHSSHPVGAQGVQGSLVVIAATTGSMLACSPGVAALSSAFLGTTLSRSSGQQQTPLASSSSNSVVALNASDWRNAIFTPCRANISSGRR